jgi:hypothetical protein
LIENWPGSERSCTLGSPDSTYFRIFKGRQKLRKDGRGPRYIAIGENHNVYLNLRNGSAKLKTFIGNWNHKDFEIFCVYYSRELFENKEFILSSDDKNLKRVASQYATYRSFKFFDIDVNYRNYNRDILGRASWIGRDRYWLVSLVSHCVGNEPYVAYRAVIISVLLKLRMSWYL